MAAISLFWDTDINMTARRHVKTFYYSLNQLLIHLVFINSTPNDIVFTLLFTCFLLQVLDIKDAKHGYLLGLP